MDHKRKELRHTTEVFRFPVPSSVEHLVAEINEKMVYSMQTGYHPSGV